MRFRAGSFASRFARRTSRRASAPDCALEPVFTVVFDATRSGQSAPSAAERLLTADDVAELLCIPRSSVYEYARRRTNALPSLLIGRHRRFERAAIEAWLVAQRAGSSSSGA